MRKPRLSRATMSRPINDSSTPVKGWLALLALGGIVILLLGCKQFKESYSQGFKQSYQTNFANSCTESAVAKGAAKETVRPQCECMAKYLVDHYDASELTKQSTNLESPETKQALAAAARACVTSAPAASAP